MNKAQRERLIFNASLLRAMRYTGFWLDQDENKSTDVEETKAYDRYISWLVQRYDLSKIPMRIFARRIEHLANYLGLFTAQQLKTFPHRRWERTYYATFHAWKRNRPVEFKKKWLRPMPRKLFRHVHSLSDPQYDFFETTLKFSQNAQRFRK